MSRHTPAHGRRQRENRNHRRAAVWLSAALVVLIAAAFTAGWSGYGRRAQSDRQSDVGMSSEAVSEGYGASPGTLERSEAPAIEGKNVARMAEQRKLDALRTQLEEHFQGYRGNWQVYVADADSGASIAINNHQQHAASLIKLYIMLAVFQEMHDGHLNESQSIDELLTQMITVSSNQAANDLITQLGNGDDQRGFTLVNDIALQYGFTQTSLNDLLYDSGTHDANRKTTSSQDCGRFMNAVYDGSLVSDDASQRMLSLLLAQTRRSKIPAGLPDGTHVANKTGEIPGTENDAALVYTTSGAYVITVLTQDIPDSSNAQSGIREISRMTWESMIG
ncbi:MAG: serine hydrolase [Bifidobacterium crudilactis]|uniref:serine hydrolase n=1 Tax=Bifidobacterium crudilactis TaxID=327277 RepID=UPI003F9E5C22